MLKKAITYVLMLALSFLLISCKESSTTSPTTSSTSTTIPTTTTTSSTTTVTVKPVTIRETGEGFDKIQDAIEKAEPGQHIDVSAGTYVENLVVNKKLNLIGENRATTVIHAGGLLTGITFEPGAEGSDIRGFSIRCETFTSSQDGIYCAADSVIIGRNIIEKGRRGINWYAFSGGKICGVLIKNSEIGVLVPKGEPFISEADISGAVIGIDCIDTSPIIAGCTLKRNHVGILCDVSAQPDVGGGVSGSPGRNIIKENAFWNFYNYTPNVIKAKNNYWDHTTAGEIDQYDIFDDDEDTGSFPWPLGAVDFEPFLTGPPIATLRMKRRLLYASSLFADFFRSLFRSDLPISAISISPSLEPKLHITRFDLLGARYRSLTAERYYPPLMLRAGR